MSLSTPFDNTAPATATLPLAGLGTHLVAAPPASDTMFANNSARVRYLWKAGEVLFNSSTATGLDFNTELTSNLAVWEGATGVFSGLSSISLQDIRITGEQVFPTILFSAGGFALYAANMGKSPIVNGKHVFSGECYYIDAEGGKREGLFSYETEENRYGTGVSGLNAAFYIRSNRMTSPPSNTAPATFTPTLAAARSTSPAIPPYSDVLVATATTGNFFSWPPNVTTASQFNASGINFYEANPNFTINTATGVFANGQTNAKAEDIKVTGEQDFPSLMFSVGPSLQLYATNVGRSPVANGRLSFSGDFYLIDQQGVKREGYFIYDCASNSLGNRPIDLTATFYIKTLGDRFTASNTAAQARPL